MISCLVDSEMADALEEIRVVNGRAVYTLSEVIRASLAEGIPLAPARLLRESHPTEPPPAEVSGGAS